MKKLVVLILSIFVIVATSCKKDDTSTPASLGSWTLDGVAHKVAFSSKGSTSGGSPSFLFIFADGVPAGPDSKVNTFNLSFKAAPTASGTFQLSGTVGGNLSATQCELFAGSSSGVYAYIGSPINIDVKVSNGKITFTIPEITVKSTSKGADVKLTASVTEM